MSSETANFMADPEKAIRVANVSTPVVPSNTYHQSRFKLRTYLYDSLLSADFKNLTSSDGTVGKGELYDFIV